MLKFEFSCCYDWTKKHFLFLTFGLVSKIMISVIGCMRFVDWVVIPGFSDNVGVSRDFVGVTINEVPNAHFLFDERSEWEWKVNKSFVVHAHWEMGRGFSLVDFGGFCIKKTLISSILVMSFVPWSHSLPPCLLLGLQNLVKECFWWQKLLINKIRRNLGFWC